MSSIPSIASQVPNLPQVAHPVADVDGDSDGSKGPDPVTQNASATPHLPNPTATLGNSINTHA